MAGRTPCDYGLRATPNGRLLSRLDRDDCCFFLASHAWPKKLSATPPLLLKSGAHPPTLVRATTSSPNAEQCLRKALRKSLISQGIFRKLSNPDHGGADTSDLRIR